MLKTEMEWKVVNIFSSPAALALESIWKICMSQCFYQHPPLDWQDVLDEACQKWRTKKLQGVQCKLILSYTVYHIWHTRNEIKAKGHLKMEE